MEVSNLTARKYGLDIKNFELIKKLVNAKCGIIKSLHLFLRENEDLPIYNVVAHHSNIGILYNEPNRGIRLRSGGTGMSLNEAIGRAIGEVIERYCWNLFGHVYRKDLVFGSYRELEKKGFSLYPIEKIYLFSKSQYSQKTFPFTPLTENTLLTWVPMIDEKKNEIYYPAQLVIGDYKLHHKENIIGYSTTSGVATGHTYKEAIMRGILEQIERDAFLLTWYCKLRPPKLKISTDSYREIFGEIYRNLANSVNYYFEIFDITLDIPVPTVLSLLISKRKFPDMKVIVGCSSNLDYKKAIYKAILESIQGVPYAKRSLLFENYKNVDIENISNFDDNFIYYLGSSNFKKFQFLLRSKRVKAIEKFPTNNKEKLRELFRILKRKKFKILMLNLTSPEISELGLYVTKVLIPELVQLSVPSYPFLGNPRFKRFQLKSQTLNKYPHPLP